MVNIHVIDRTIEPGVPKIAVEYRQMLKAIASDVAIFMRDPRYDVCVAETNGIHDEKVYLWHDITLADKRPFIKWFSLPTQLITAYNRAFMGVDPVMLYVAQVDRDLQDFDFPEETRTLRFTLHRADVNGHNITDTVRNHAEVYANKYNYRDVTIDIGARSVWRALSGG